VILELVILDIKPGSNQAYERAFAQAAPLIAASQGHVSHELKRCIETPHRYVLMVQWESLEAHTIGFRQSAAYQQWKALLHHFYDPFPVVEHYVALGS
jgi:heme-degrading monooxygenase HmoA